MKILIASRIDPGAIAKLSAEHDVQCVLGATPDELCERIADREVLVFRSGVNIDARVIDAARSLRLIVRAGSGMDNIDLERVEARGIRFERIPLPGAHAVAEMSFALMLALARNVPQADRLLRRGRWLKHELTGFRLGGKVLGVVGAGNIGSLVGRLGAAWGMEVLGCVASDRSGDSERLARCGIRRVELPELLRRSDFVTVHVPLLPSTRHLIDAAALARMKPGAFLVNLARGGVVDEEALRNALVSGSLAGAALDVHAREGEGVMSPLADLPNVILTPHIGAQTFDAQREIGEAVVGLVGAEADRESPAYESLAQAG